MCCRNSATGIAKPPTPARRSPSWDQAELIDLLITDVGLPGMNGRQLAEIAREHRPDLQAYSSSPAMPRPPTERSDFLGPGMEMMAKPFAIEALAAKVRLLLEA